MSDVAGNIAGVGAPSEIRCGLCGNGASLKCKNIPGYQEPMHFDIMYCAHCDTSFAFPMDLDNKIYDLIYSNISKVPGYKRYYDYALNVVKQKEPLKYLASNEDVYWSIDDFLQKFSISQSDSILEIGCGFGYLTYAIASSGYNIMGLDISQEAVDNATKRYGQHYVCADLKEYAKVHSKQYDVVIMTEILEHVPDVTEFVKALDTLVKDDGFIVLTTPNKSAYPGEVVWETDLPPVHLWWLSETSIKTIAERVGREVIFTDFSEYNSANPLPRRRVSSGLPSRKPFFSASNELLLSAVPRKKSWLSRTFKMLRTKFVNRYHRSLSAPHDNAGRDILCAVLVKK